MSKKEFLLKLKDPEAYNIIVEGIHRLKRQYPLSIQDVAWEEDLPQSKGERRWHVVFHVWFNDWDAPSRLRSDIKHNFQQGDPDISVTLHTPTIDTRIFAIYVSRRWER